MKPHNRPGRKNIRRLDALDRLAKKKNKDAAEIEGVNLRAAIVSQSHADAIRTKKDRSARGKFQRHP